MTDNTALGDRMKTFERVNRTVLPRRIYSVLRVDGRAFHSYLRHVVKPFDEHVTSCMILVACQLLEEVDGAVLAYTQSDECSLVFTDLHSINFEPWFGGVVQKIVSMSASIATATFNKGSLYYQMQQRAGQIEGFDVPARPALFDSRVFSIPDPVEVANYLIWRQRDAVRNSIQMVGQHYFSHKELQGVGNDLLQEKLWSEKGVNWNDYLPQFKRGTVAYRTPKNQEEERSEVIVIPAPHFKAEPGSLLADILPPMPSLS